jgi:hypothetical protein
MPPHVDMPDVCYNFYNPILNLMKIGNITKSLLIAWPKPPRYQQWFCHIVDNEI